MNKFDVFTQINATPKDLLLAQKFYAVVNRKRNKGRDFFDIIFLLSQGLVPNYEYLHAKIGVQKPEELRQRIIEKCSELDMKAMAIDVKPFLLDSKDENKVLLFPKYMEEVKLS